MAQKHSVGVMPARQPYYLASTGQHPRRRLPHESVSLKHSVVRNPNSNPERGNAANSDTSSKVVSPASSLNNNRSISRESSNADKWFENSNNTHKSSAAMIEDEPPFFLNNSSTETHPESTSAPDPATLPFRPSLGRFASNGSGSEEYRSVIDDLTVENKMLKRRLRKYEKPQEQDLQADRLFEIRMHGLSPAKKRELEQILSQFTAGLSTPCASQNMMNISNQNLPPPLLNSKPSFSQCSARVADSGYGSMATSIHPSSNTASSNNRGKITRMTGLEASKARNQNIHSYLHDIPEGLLPQQPPLMTEDACKRLVVSRLEQVFGGRGAAVDGHQHQIQQQEVSQIAAKDDLTAIEARGHRVNAEGQREAPIMGLKKEEHLNHTIQEGRADGVEHHHLSRGTHQEKVEEHDPVIDTTSSEQRPTRPLDLDPYRAQIPAENLEYIRHLGFALPDTHSRHADEEGWVYLNLLTNMAQLHTLNVTNDFIKRAIMECSSRFELSSDGRKIRWRSGQSPLDLREIGSGNSVHSNLSDDKSHSRLVRKRPYHQVNDQDLKSGQQFEPAAKKAALANDKKHAYTPMFTHSRRSDEDAVMNCDDASESSPMAENVTGHSSAFPSTLKRSTSSDSPNDNGVIVFYNNSNFYTDLSGDHQKVLRTSKANNYSIASNFPLGHRFQPGVESGSTLGNTFEMSKDPVPSITHSAEMASKPLQVYEDAEKASSRPTANYTITEDLPLDLEACGVGGVYPQDNFAVFVKREISRETLPRARRLRPWTRVRRQVPPRSFTPRVGENALENQTKHLPPSQLPEAMYTLSPETTDSDDGTSETNGSEQEPVAGGKGATSIVSDDSDRNESESSSIASMQSENESEHRGNLEQPDVEMEENDEQIDFLAVARKADPEQVARKEREYDAEMAERLAEDIPAGSSAATCRGVIGSGCNSPELDEVEGDEEEEDEASVSS